MSEATRGPRERPTSPHLQVWRWHITMLTSILHRASGCALYGGALIAAAWAVSLAGGPDTYATFMTLLGSPLGKLVMFGLTLGLMYHLASGLRHLIWDAGHGFDLKTANALSVFTIAFAIAATAALWAIAYMTGAI